MESNHMKNLNNQNSEKPLPELEEFYDEFLQNRSSELHILQTALQANNLSVVTNLSHQWKGFCSPYGFGTLASMAVELEQLAKRTDIDSCYEVLSKMKIYLDSKAKSTV
jgi:HPt (histidine-containing phosphotransfer) domain-containing protein